MKIWIETECPFCGMTNFVLWDDAPEEFTGNNTEEMVTSCHSCERLFWANGAEPEEEEDDIFSDFVFEGKASPLE